MYVLTKRIYKTMYGEYPIWCKTTELDKINLYERGKVDIEGVILEPTELGTICEIKGCWINCESDFQCDSIHIKKSITI